MRLYFVRHAIAEDPTPDMLDTERQLTPKGIKRFTRSADTVKALGIEAARLYSSPLVRARQTAEILAKALDVEMVIRNEVGPGFGLAAIQTLTADLAPDSAAIFVGHEPDMSSAISTLIGGGNIVMKQGSFARVDLVSTTPLRGQLIWLLAPRVLVAGD
jgi:phosphohistidine phosphatase